MHISVEPREDYAILHLRGEFDTYYVPALEQEIETLAKAGIVRVVLNLRLVKFINSTALGAMIKHSKSLGARGGKLVIARPSPFCRDIIEKVGLDRVVNVFDSDEDAADSFRSKKASATGHAPEPEEQSSVLFTLTDAARLEKFLSHSKRTVTAPITREKSAGWGGAGRMLALDEKGLRFTWTGGTTGLSPSAMAELLAIGTELKVKFRLPLLQRGYCEAACIISEIEERAEGVKLGATFSSIDHATKDAIKRYATDMQFLKEELRKATDK